MAGWGEARVEFLALWPEIKKRVEAGETLKRVYEDLLQARRITMCQSAFYNKWKALTTATPKKPPSPSSPKSIRIPKQQKSPSTTIERTGGIRFVTEAPRVASTALDKEFWGDPDTPDSLSPDSNSTPSPSEAKGDA
ncbi:MAG: hypothetical protein K9H25_17130 [Rhodospirillum sp.]|nr:hypothetical protein [Rhodospirillum sp.]MCF8501775.1 hypothetical protein [Rhodospirillum sp.]